MSTPSFPQLLAAEIATMQRFVSLLNEEKAILGGGRLETLARVIESKGVLAEELNTLGEQRRRCLQSLGVEENKEAVERWLNTLEDHKLLLCWNALRQLAREAKALNERNGQCIALLARNNRQLLDALSGQKTISAVYGPDGQTASGAGLRISDLV
jgi:flagellar biosynthesis/type III secretory pathway chaperone